MVDPRVFRTYDIRALVPELVDESSAYYGRLNDPSAYQAPLTPDGVRQIGRGIAALAESDTVAIGRDSRLSSPAWAEALSEGLLEQGVDVIDLGLTTTDMVYFVSGARGIPAVQITASHCTRELNGMKIVRAGARVVGMGSGMEELRDIVLSQRFPGAGRAGRKTAWSCLTHYVDHLLGFVDTRAIQPIQFIADAGNGTAGPVAQALLERIPQARLTPMFFEPDGRFPNHEANPFELENIRELMARVPEEGADFGVAWDGDADRVFFLDETGRYIPGDFITALIARFHLERNPGAAIVYDLRASRVVRDWVERLGGRAISERVGHSFIKQTMRREDAVFGGEVSGHYYFRRHWYADNGFAPLLILLALLSREGVPLSRLIAGLGDYHVSGEINSAVTDAGAVMARIRERYADANLDTRDGLTVEFPEWRFNVRPSANDPLLRLNLEARSPEQLQARLAELLALIRE